MAKKNYPVMLKKDVPILGRAGEMVEVRPGYALNYLFPLGLATRVTPGIIKEAALRRAKQVERLAALKQQAESQKTALEAIGRFTIHKKVGEGDALFGTVTNENVAEVILAISGLQVDRRSIVFEDIHKTGIYPVQVNLHPEVQATIRIQVTPE